MSWRESLEESLRGEFEGIVIGAGANGLVAAAALGRAGLRVLVLEAQDEVGGLACASAFAPGFRCAPFAGDAGWVPPPVMRGLRLDGLERAPAGNGAAYAVAVEPGAFLVLPADPVAAAAAIALYSAEDAAAWPGFTARLHTMAGFLEVLYAAPPPDVDAATLGALLRMLSLARRFRGLGREGMIDLLRTLPMPVQQLCEESFTLEPLQAALAACAIRDSGLGPRAGGTGFLLLHGLAGAPPGAIAGRGAWAAGSDAFIASAERAARGAGVTIRTSARVTRIEVRDDAVTGVMLENGDDVRAPLVLSSADPAHTLLRLVDPVWLDPEFLLAVRNIRMRGSTAAVLYALDALPEIPGLDAAALAGTVSLTSSLDALERAADAVKYGRLPDALHIEISAPTLHWPRLAPAHRHVLVAHVQHASHALRDGGWDDARTALLADRVTGAIEAVAPGFASRVLHRSVLTPREIERRWGLTGGAITHGQLMLDQILFMRPLAGWAHYATPVDGLYLCGAGAHPGPGVPGGAGWLAARRVLHDRKQGTLAGRTGSR